MTARPDRPAGATSRVLLVAGILLVAANLRPALTGVGPLLDEIRADLGLSGTAGGVLAALPLLMFAAFAPVSSAVAIRFGAERTIWGALAALAAGTALRSVPVAGGIWAGTVVLGAAIAFFNVLLPSVVKRDFPTRIGPMIGLYSAVQSVVAAIASGVAVPIAGDRSGGWRLALGGWGILAVVGAVVWLPQLRRAHPVAAERAPKIGSPWRSVLAWQVSAFMGLQSLVFYVAIAWLPSITKSSGASASTAGWLLFLYQVVSVVASLVMSAVIQRTRDQRWPGFVAAAFGLTGVLGLIAAPSWAAVWITLMGFGSGASIVLALSLFGLRTLEHNEAAALSGMAQLVGYLLAAAGPVTIGAVHDATGSWRVPLEVLAALIVAQGSFVVLAGRDRVVRWPLRTVSDSTDG